MQIINDITKLTDQWYNIVGSDHHKDRDCHWYINTVWSYGEPPKYRIEHYGYIHDEVLEEFTSYAEALIRLKVILTNIIAEEIKFREQQKIDEAEYWKNKE